MATVYYCRNDGGTAVQCNGIVDAAYPGSGTGQACAYSSIQTAVNACVGGDTVMLKLETHTITGSITLPAHSGASYATIKGPEDSLIPAPALIRQPMGAGVTAHMPVISTTNTNSDPVFAATTGGFWKVSGVMITDNATLPNGQGGFIYVSLSGGSNYLFDRCVIKPKGYPVQEVNNYNTNARWAFRSNATNVTLQDSDLLGFYGTYPGGAVGSGNQDGGGILSDIGPGPLTVQRCYIEPFFDGVLLGGTDPPASPIQTVSGSPTLTTATVSSTAGLSTGMTFAVEMVWDVNFCKDDNTHPCWGNSVVSGIAGNNLTFPPLICNTAGGGARVACTQAVKTPGQAIWSGQTVSSTIIQQNHFYTPLAYSIWLRANNTNHPKAIIETKICNGLLFDGNYMDGFPNTFGTTSYNQSGGSPWTGVLNATFSNNWISSFNVGTFDPLADPYYINTPGTNLIITNNLMTGPDNGGALSGVTNNWLEGKGGVNISITHNTVLTGYPTAYVGGTVKSQLANPTYYGQPALTFKDNLWGFGDYGMVCDSATPQDCWPSYVENHNLLALNVNPPNSNPATQFPNSTTAASWAAVLFTGATATTVTDWRLQTGSPGHHAASDGSDIGVNITTLMTALGITTTVPTAAVAGKIAMAGKVTIS